MMENIINTKTTVKRIAVAALVITMIMSGVAYATMEQQPNLTPYPAADIRIVTSPDGSKLLRFSTLSWNKGSGPLEIRAGAVDNLNGKQEVVQRIYSDDGSYRDVLAGSFEWHPTHGHVHFNDYALYTLQPVDAPGASERTGSKTTFCIMDTTRGNTKLPGAPKRAYYKTCGSSVQGMSVGWGDKYGYNLSGQSIDITGMPNGDYDLKIEIDPKDRIIESGETDNTSTAHIRITDGTVKVLP